MKISKKTMKHISLFVLCLIMIIGSSSIPNAIQAKNSTRSTRTLTGANEIAMSEAMVRGLNAMKKSTATANVIGVSDEWIKYLRGKWNDNVGLATNSDGTSGGSVNFEWYTGIVSTGWKWSGAIANTTGDITTEPLAKPVKDGSNTYEVYSGEQLYFALTSAVAGDTVKLMTDIDLNGAEKSWLSVSLAVNTTLDGNGKTIYNLGGLNTCFITTLTRSTVKNINFEYVNIIYENTRAYVGIIGGITTDQANKPSVLENIAIKNAMLFSGYDEASTFNQSYISPFGHVEHANINKCSIISNKIFGAKGMHVGGAFARLNDCYVSNSFSVDTVVVAVGEHSGGFISCSDNITFSNDSSNSPNTKITDCFTNNTVYGNKTTGVFIGAINIFTGKSSQQMEFERCYASGSVEGTESLGGFVSHVDVKGGGTIKFTDCYSTSIVGMQKGGSKLGGFIGSVSDSGNYLNLTFTNCYAAGEVGGIDTDVSADRKTNLDVGGFFGTYPLTSTKIIFNNCYYDKQTTAMREWETGNSRDAAPNLTTTDTSLGSTGTTTGGLYKKDISGLSGVLTSDSDKSGAGLASKPKTAATGFTGFTDTSTPANDKWIYDGRLTEDVDNEKHNCMYPQLKTFSTPSEDATTKETLWGQYTNLVKAFSYASVATVHENVWEHCVSKDHVTLNTTTYDTVRDLTSAFTMTSYADLASADTVVKWTTDKTKTSLYGKTVSVIGDLDYVDNKTWNRKYYRADKFAPGIEWFTVTFTIGSGSDAVTGTRKLRVIPTANITPGADQSDLKIGTTYNQADDMKMAYSTGTRMATSQSNVIDKDSNVVTKYDDVTQGIYPTNNVIQSQKDIVQNIYLDSGSGYTATGTYDQWTPTWTNETIDRFSYTNKTTGDQRLISTNFMDGADGTAHNPNNYIKVNFYKLEMSSTSTTGEDSDIKLEFTDSDLIALEDSSGITTWGKKLTGQESFTESDIGRYLIEYIWVLPDARYIKDSKMINIKKDNHNVTLNIVDEKNRPNDKSLSLAIGEIQNDVLIPEPQLPATGASTISKTNIPTNTQIYLACGRVDPTDDKNLTKLKFEYGAGDNYQVTEKEVDASYFQTDSSPGKPITLDFVYYYGSYEYNGDYYVKKVTVKREYYLKVDSNNHYIILKLNNTFDVKDKEGNTILNGNDVDDDMVITVTIEPPGLNVGTLELQKLLVDESGNVITPSTQQKTDRFAIKVTDDYGFQATYILNPATGVDNLTTIQLSPGNYTIEEIVPMNYAYTGMVQNGTAVTDKKVQITIEANQTTTVKVKNKYTQSGGVKGGVTNELERK